MTVINTIKQISHKLYQFQIILGAAFTKFLYIKILVLKNKFKGIQMEYTSSKTQFGEDDSSFGIQTDHKQQN